MKKTSQKGFTLIELIVVAVIIAILSTIGMVSYSSTTARSRDTKRKSDLQQIRAALEMYRADHAGYPLFSTMATVISTLNTDGYVSFTSLPDPKSGFIYIASTGACAAEPCPSYYLCAYLEKGPATGDANCAATVDCNTTTGTDCNYGVLNP